MKRLLILILLFTFRLSVYGQGEGEISGFIKSSSGDPGFLNIQLKGTKQGTTADSSGRFRLQEVAAGRRVLIVSGLGFRTLEQELRVVAGEITEVEVLVIPDVLSFDEVVVSASRNGVRRADAPVLVSLLNSEDFSRTQSVCLAEGLNFQPGLRTETDCQTCNYTQLRMNGLGGGYSQILVNSRPIFSSLAGLYGLEQIPANMIDRVEVVRGGGSALFGSSAVAGTVNIITRDPEDNRFGFSVNQSFIDGQAPDNVLNANASVVAPGQRLGLSLFGSRRQRGEYDGNGDGFSELSRLLNYSFGANAFARPSERVRLGFSLNRVSEQRDGGDLLDLPPHERTQAESRQTDLLLANADLEVQFSDRRRLTVYAGGQRTRRSHYTGLYGADGYGNTDNYTLQGGAQYRERWEDGWPGPVDLTAGLEYQLDDIRDEIPAYNYLVDQTTRQWGAFGQADWQVLPRLRLLLGGRLTGHNLVEAPVFTPRLGLIYEPLADLRLRASYAAGFRAPQAFDTDLHIAFAGGGITTIRIDPALQPEHSDSYNLSLDFDRPGERSIFGFTLAAFFTRLSDAFVLEEAGNDGEGNMILEKRNGSHSTVAGATVEARANFDNVVEFDLGFTWQRSTYDEAVDWSAEVPGTSTYLRTPDQYGYYTLSFFNEKDLRFYLSGVFTGSMLVPHFGGAPGVDGDRLVLSPSFLETNIKLSYRLALGSKAPALEFFGGVQNIFNAYQSDFDAGPERDSNYVYGPARPRTFYFGMKISTARE